MQNLKSIPVATLRTAAARLLRSSGRPGAKPAEGIDRALLMAATNYREERRESIDLSQAIVDRANVLVATESTITTEDES
jgi:hypothetical protein